MDFATVLDRGGGTLRTTGFDAFSARLRRPLQRTGHGCTIAVVGGSAERETEIVIEPGALRVLVPA